MGGWVGEAALAVIAVRNFARDAVHPSNVSRHRARETR